jgi:hypothetical protein
MECFYPRGVGCDIGCTGVVLLWSFRGEFMVRCGRLKAKGCRSFRRWQPSVFDPYFNCSQLEITDGTGWGDLVCYFVATDGVR